MKTCATLCLGAVLALPTVSGLGAGDSNGQTASGGSRRRFASPWQAASGGSASSQSSSQSASSPSTQPVPTPVEQFNQSLRLLQAGQYAEADRIATALAADPDHPLFHAWLVAGQARQSLRRLPEAAEAYKRFLAASDTPVGREFVQRQLRLCESAGEPASGPSLPSSSLTAQEKKDLAVVEPNDVVETTEHFIVTARNAKLARLLGLEAEGALKRICGLILGGQEYPHRVEIHVWADRKDYLTHAPGATNWSGGSFSLSREGGVVKRRIDLAQLDEKRELSLATLDRATPHELCHLVIAEFFGDAPCPLFLSEALAMLAEPEPDNDRLLLAGAALAGRGKIALPDLLIVDAGRIDKPDLFYAESYSFLLYLRQRLGEKPFAEMVQNIKDGLPLADALQRALHAPEDPDFLKLLQAAWEKYAIDQAQYIRALRTPSTKPGG